MKYRVSFHICKTAEEAEAICQRENSTGSQYKRQHHKAHYTPWTSADRTETGYIVWFWA